jgi:hypothetical protein
MGIANAATLDPKDLMAQIRQREFQADTSGYIRVGMASSPAVPVKTLADTDAKSLIDTLKTACGKDVPDFLEIKEGDDAKAKQQQQAKALNAFMKLPWAQRQALIDNGAMGTFLKAAAEQKPAAEAEAAAETEAAAEIKSPEELANAALAKATKNARAIPEYQGTTVKLADVKKEEIDSNVENIDTALENVSLEGVKKPVTVENIIAARVPKGLTGRARNKAKLFLTGLLKSMPPKIRQKYLENPQELAKLVDKAAFFSTISKDDSICAHCTYPENDPKSVNKLYIIPDQLQHNRTVMSGLANFETILNASPRLTDDDKATIRGYANKFLQGLTEDEFRRFQRDPLDFTAELLADIKRQDEEAQRERVQEETSHLKKMKLLASNALGPSLFQKIEISHVYVTPIKKGADCDGALREHPTTLADRIKEYPFVFEEEEVEEVNLVDERRGAWDPNEGQFGSGALSEHGVSNTDDTQFKSTASDTDDADDADDADDGAPPGAAADPPPPGPAGPPPGPAPAPRRRAMSLNNLKPQPGVAPAGDPPGPPGAPAAP